MKLERPTPTAFRLTLHPHELSALVAAARWVVEAEGEVTEEARVQIRQVLRSYDLEMARLAAP